MRLMYTNSGDVDDWWSSESTGFDGDRNRKWLRLYTGVGPNYIQEFNKLLL